MSVDATGDVILLIGACHVEDAEPLSAALAERARPVDIGQCRHLHSAVLQALLSLEATVIGVAPDESLQNLIEINLRYSDASRESL
jgi:hypothetical protein